MLIITYTSSHCACHVLWNYEVLVSVKLLASISSSPSKSISIMPQIEALKRTIVQKNPKVSLNIYFSRYFKMDCPFSEKKNFKNLANAHSR